jgi:hypothetical protein
VLLNDGFYLIDHPTTTIIADHVTIKSKNGPDAVTVQIRDAGHIQFGYSDGWNDYYAEGDTIDGITFKGSSNGNLVIAYGPGIVIKNCNFESLQVIRKSTPITVYQCNLNCSFKPQLSKAVFICNATEPVTYTYRGQTYTGYVGNYYRDYAGADADGNGIGDVPYGNDNYPLVGFWKDGVIIPPKPTAGFSAYLTSGNAPLAVQLTDESTGTVSSYAWDFDNDGQVDRTGNSHSD